MKLGLNSLKMKNSNAIKSVMILKNQNLRNIPDSNQNNMSQSKYKNVRKLFRNEHYQSNVSIVIRRFFVNSINTSNFINQAIDF